MNDENSQVRDTIPAEAITERDIRPPEPLERAIVSVDFLRGEVAALKVTVAELSKRIAKPPWLDELFEKIANITPAASISAEIVVLRERLSETVARCDERHDRDPLPLGIPGNGRGGG